MDDKNAVWIDRQEYERLKELDEQAYAGVGGAIGSARPVAAPAGTTVVVSDPQEKANNILVILTAISAVISFLFPPALLIFLGLGIASIIQYTKGKSKKTRIAVGAVAAITGVIILVAVAPFIMIIAFIILWQLGCWTGLGECRSV